jgi:aldose 1-epimerase
MGKDQLHGGIEGFDKKVWQMVSDNSSLLELKYLSKDGEEGFPGDLETTIRFELNDQNEFSYEFSAITNKPTAVNLTHHSYFNLNNGVGTIEDHEVKIYASNILSQDEGLVCDGKLIPVQNTPFDFRNFKSVNKDWGKINGYDQCFVVDNKTTELSLVAETRSLKSGITLQIFSTDTAVQFYTAQGFPEIKGKKGTLYGSFSGLCLETHKHPNAINISHFPNTVLRPGEIYKQKNVYKVSAAEVK